MAHTDDTGVYLQLVQSAKIDTKYASNLPAGPVRKEGMKQRVDWWVHVQYRISFLVFIV